MDHSHEEHHEHHASCGPGYASPMEAMEKAEREKVLHTIALYVGTNVDEPDYLATVDVDPESATYSLYGSWDNQLDPKIAEEGSYMLQIDCDTEQGGMKINEDFFVDVRAEPAGPVRAHEMRHPGGDVTSDIWI